MLAADCFNQFLQNTHQLLAVIELEKSYLQETQLTKLHSLYQEKLKLFEANQAYANLLFEESLIEQLEIHQKKAAIDALNNINNSMQSCLQLLEVSSKGNRKALEIHSQKKNNPSVLYSALGKLRTQTQYQSAGIQHAY